MADYADIDIALDLVPQNGGTASLQAMWMAAGTDPNGDALCVAYGCELHDCGGLA